MDMWNVFCDWIGKDVFFWNEGFVELDCECVSVIYCNEFVVCGDFDVFVEIFGNCYDYFWCVVGDCEYDCEMMVVI